MSLGPHYAPGEEEEIVEETEEEEEEEEEEDGLEYATDAPSGDSYMTPPSTGGCSEPSLVLVIVMTFWYVYLEWTYFF